MKQIFHNFLFLLLAACSFSACTKEGELQTAAKVIDTRLTNMSLEDAHLSFSIFVDGNAWGDTLNRGQAATGLLEKKAGKQRIVIKDAHTPATLIDTLIELPDNKAELMVLQLNADDKPVLILQKAEPAGGSKEKEIAFLYTNKDLLAGAPAIALPDSLHITIYGIDVITFEGKIIAQYEKVKKGQLTPYKKFMYDAYNVFYLLEVRTTNGELISQPVDLVNFTGGLLSANYTENKHIIFALQAAGTAFPFDYQGVTLVDF